MTTHNKKPIKKSFFHSVTIVALFVALQFSSGCRQSDNREKNIPAKPMSYGVDFFQLDSDGLGIQVGDSNNSEFSVMGNVICSGLTVTISKSNAAAAGTIVGGDSRQFLSGQIVWDSVPSSGKDLSGKFTFTLNNGSYVADIFIPASAVRTSCAIHTSNARISVRRK